MNISTTGKMKSWIGRTLGVLQIFIGIGAIGGGLALIMEPGGTNLGMPLDMLNDSPFTDFLIPGLVLLMVNGFGSMAGAVLSFKLFRYAGEIALALGAFLIAWITIQVYWIHGFHWLHALYLCLGIIEFALGWLLRKTAHTP